MRRMPVSKGKSARQFRRNVSRTARINTSKTPMRGGWRL